MTQYEIIKKAIDEHLQVRLLANSDRIIPTKFDEDDPEHSFIGNDGISWAFYDDSHKWNTWELVDTEPDYEQIVEELLERIVADDCVIECLKVRISSLETKISFLEDKCIGK